MWSQNVGGQERVDRPNKHTLRQAWQRAQQRAKFLLEGVYGYVRVRKQRHISMTVAEPSPHLDQAAHCRYCLPAARTGNHTLRDEVPSNDGFLLWRRDEAHIIRP